MQSLSRNSQSIADQLSVKQSELYHACDLSRFPFATTAELEPLEEHLGQSRAMQALKFGIGIKQEGYNLFVLGSSGLGKQTTIRELLSEQAEETAVPSDWCYVNNFEQAHKPLILSLPKGMGRQLQQDMLRFIDDLLIALPAAFESDEYHAALQTINEEYLRREEQSLDEAAAKAEKNNIMMMRTPSGWNLGPKQGDKVMSPEEFSQLPDEEQQAVTQVVEEVRDELKRILRQIPKWQKESRAKVKQLNREVSQGTVKQYAEDLKQKYLELDSVIHFVDKVTEDVIENTDLFRKYAAEMKDSSQTGINKLPPEFNAYQVNVLVDHTATQGAPVVFEDHPSYQNLIGRIEHIAHFGSLITDFSLIKPGVLHQANGGYLVLDVRKILSSPYAWEGLKRALSSREIKIESLEQLMSLASTTSLQPEPIPLDIKVVLTGSRLLYYLLKHYDPEFSRLFKVSADFSEDMIRDDDNIELYVRLIAGIQQRNHLLPLDRNAVEKVIEQSSRMAQDAFRISLHMGNLSDLLVEADHWARKQRRESIAKQDVRQAIEMRLFMMGQIKERLQEAVIRGIYKIATSGEAVAQVNGLSVMELDGYAFGRPSRITATARLGSGKVIDIEREVELGGAIHSKGVMILSSYLASHYARERPLALSATLVFEQSYGSLEGDSASAAELCTLLSAIAEVPLKQSLAITGSVNQHGEIQAIGGVNEKVEGFFDICRERGLSGEQGVIIPHSNIQHLMLKEEIVQAVEKGKFHLYAVSKIDEAMTLLTGVEMGMREDDGKYPTGTLNALIDKKLVHFAALQQQFAKSDHGENRLSKRRSSKDS
ncbi:Lon protease family protein [Thiomicrorhabdus sp. 6S3-12]|uniref:Lon protease family protein n=1 Tax=Thiomicrorhabdus sp. 6S3-12 TaxID=2819681 RepID=UPI001AAC8940|nr:ATP-binding protein [Thiomicrorhabdus sp. 6S3-12]MBO1924318.1 AAA family ATPase [Thiomicrorhabdus sp. 6S3-12]